MTPIQNDVILDTATQDDATQDDAAPTETAVEEAPLKAVAQRPASLDNAQVRFLRGEAHAMQPIMRIGSKRVTDAVVAHVDELLEARELIKIKMLDADKGEIGAARDEIVARTGAHAVHMIGGTLILFRRRQTDPELRLPGERPFARSKARVLKPRRSSRPGGKKGGMGGKSAAKNKGMKRGSKNYRR
jgi:RNA-binding protein